MPTRPSAMAASAEQGLRTGHGDVGVLTVSLSMIGGSIECQGGCLQMDGQMDHQLGHYRLQRLIPELHSKSANSIRQYQKYRIPLSLKKSS